VKDAYVYSFDFIFQISPSYFEALKRTQKDSDISLFGFTEGILTRLGDAPTPEPALPPDMITRLDAVKRQSWRDAEGTSCCLVVEVDKNATFSKAVRLFLMLLACLGLVLLCTFFVMIVPLFRSFRWGSAIFPFPFTLTLATNAFIQLACLLSFLWMFTSSSTRLEWIGQALAQLEQRTLAPSSTAGGTPTAPGQAVGDSSPTKSTTFREATSAEDPFQLFIDTTKGYDPSDASWVGKWQTKERALLDWHLCTRYLRVFVSKTRLTGQAVLVCAAAILGCMLLVDVEQGLRGYGALSINNQLVLQDLQDKAMETATGAVQEQADKAGEYAKSVVEGGAHAAAMDLGRRLLAGEAPFNFAHASQALVQVLRPLDAAVERTRRRQLLDMDEALNDVTRYANVGDAQHITQADLLTISMTLLLLVYSIYLLAKIARVNDKVDKHESILVQVKEKHLQKQSERERNWASTEGTASLADSDPVSQSVDQAQRSYERMLDMTIQSAHDNRGRFPLTLFSFIITQALLVAWLAAAVQPLLNQLTTVVPQLAGDACNWMESTGVGLEAEGVLENASSTFGKYVLNTKEAASHGDHSIIYSLVCVPVLNALNADVAAFVGDVDAAKNNTENEIDYDFNQAVNDNPDAARRLLEQARAHDHQLLSEPSVRRLVEEWWNAHPGDSATKLELARTMFEERSRSIRRVLTAGPEAFRAALRSRGVRAGLAAVRNQHRRSQRWTPSFSKRAPLASSGARQALFE